MAGDWIKMRMDLQTHPKVVRIMSALRADRLRIIGALHAVWCIFDSHSSDGLLDGYTLEAMDTMIGFPGFSKAMSDIGWLVDASPNGLEMPRFDEHNGRSAKRRATESERKREARKAEDCPEDVLKMSASHADKKRSREEKNINTPLTPQLEESTAKKKPRAAFALQTYLAECKQAGVKPIPDDDPVLTYAEQAKIPHEILGLHWREFVARYSEPNSKRYKDWRSVFRKSVRGNWLKLWYIDDKGDCYLTTQGRQAQAAHQQRAA